MKNFFLWGGLILLGVGCITPPTIFDESAATRPLASTLPEGILEEDLEVIPWEISNHASFMATSQDGETWIQSPEPLVRYASVPEVIQLHESLGAFPAGTLLLYFVNASQPHSDDNDTPHLIYSLDNGKTWSGRIATVFDGVKESTIVVDPSLVQLDDSRLRMYFWNIAPALDPSLRPDNPSAIFAAISSDGINFTFEQAVYQGQPIWADPEIVTFKGKWYLFLNSPDGDMSVSDDPLNFDSLTTSVLAGLPGAMVVEDELRVLVCTIKGIEEFRSADGQTFTDYGLIGPGGCDPSPIQLQDGTFILITKKANE